MKAKYQQIWIIVFACLIIALYVLSKLFPIFGEDSSATVSFDNAVASCEKEIRTRLGEKLRSLNFDKSSSRFDKAAGRHRILFVAQTNPPHSVDLQFLCVIDAENGKLVQLDMAEGKQSDNKNPFGWPPR